MGLKVGVAAHGDGGEVTHVGSDEVVHVEGGGVIQMGDGLENPRPSHRHQRRPSSAISNLRLYGADPSPGRAAKNGGGQRRREPASEVALQKRPAQLLFSVLCALIIVGDKGAHKLFDQITHSSPELAISSPTSISSHCGEESVGLC